MIHTNYCVHMSKTQLSIVLTNLSPIFVNGPIFHLPGNPNQKPGALNSFFLLTYNESTSSHHATYRDHFIELCLCDIVKYIFGLDSNLFIPTPISCNTTPKILGIFKAIKVFV